ncbi:aspartoacylase [Fibrobacterota bacterium]
MLDLPERGKNLAIRDIARIFIIGGTHGNERIGVHATQYIHEHTAEFACGSVHTIKTLIGSPKAVIRNARYIETDLNRSFTYDYSSPKSNQDVEQVLSGDGDYEIKRALEIRRELNALLKPVDFLIDLHTTTSNMGNCLIVSDNDPWTLHLCASLVGTVPECRILYDPVSRQEDRTSSSLGINQVTLEMGPVQQGVTDYPAVQTALNIIKSVIKTIDELNGKDNLASKELPKTQVFKRLNYRIDYPRGQDGIAAALIHDEFVGKDFSGLTMEQPVFITFDGRVINFGEGKYFPAALVSAVARGEEIVPFFIGEAAYVEKGMAFLTARPGLV